MYQQNVIHLLKIHVENINLLHLILQKKNIIIIQVQVYANSYYNTQTCIFRNDTLNTQENEIKNIDRIFLIQMLVLMTVAWIKIIHNNQSSNFVYL